MTTKLQETINAYKEAVKWDAQLHSIRLVNRCLPRHKQKKYDELTSKYVVRRFNADQTFQALYRKLNEAEYQEFRASASL